MFTLSVVILLAAVIAILSFPFWAADAPTERGGGPDPSKDQEQLDLQLERDGILNSLSELEVDRIQGRLNEADFERLKRTDERRLLEVIDRIERARIQEDPASGRVQRRRKEEPRRLSVAYAILLALIVVVGASAVYQFKQWQENQEFLARTQGDQGVPDPREMLARLEGRLKSNPNDLQGQIMAGRSYMALGRLEEAQQAWSKVAELDPGNHEAHFSLGVILLQGSTPDPKVYETALNQLNIALVKVPEEPAILWYKGIALVHLKRFNEADESWTAAFRNLDPSSEDAQMVKKALQSLRAGTPPEF